MNKTANKLLSGVWKVAITGCFVGAIVFFSGGILFTYEAYRTGLERRKKLKSEIPSPALSKNLKIVPYMEDQETTIRSDLLEVERRIGGFDYPDRVNPARQ